MANLISQKERNLLTGIFGDIFDTFKREIVIHKESVVMLPQKILNQYNQSNVGGPFGYGEEYQYPQSIAEDSFPTFNIEMENSSTIVVNGYRLEERLFYTLSKGITYRFDLSHPSNSGHLLSFYRDPSETYPNAVEPNNWTRAGTPGASGAYALYTTPSNEEFSRMDVLSLQCDSPYSTFAHLGEKAYFWTSTGLSPLFTQEMKGVFYAIVRYSDDYQFKSIDNISTNIPYGHATIKVRADAREYINVGKTKKIVFDKLSYELAGSEKVHQFLGSEYFIYSLKLIG